MPLIFRIDYLANPARFMRLSAVLRPMLGLTAPILLILGLWLSLFQSPPDYQQGEWVRLLYVHVPMAWLGMGCYLVMGFCSLSFLVWRHPLALLTARALAPVGALFTGLCLITGMLWGKPTWGTWWVWDARLTSMLLLLFLYMGYILLEREEKLSSMLSILGLVNLPIIHFSVYWWQTLHQPSSILRADGIAMHPSMLWPLCIQFMGFWCVTALIVLWRLETMLYIRKGKRP
jgi:heme exporter protein C